MCSIEINYNLSNSNIMNVKRCKLLKDVTKIRNITKDIISSYGETPKSEFLRDASMSIIDEGRRNINTKFFLRQPVEETKTLIAMHNLTEEKLEKAIDLGGFPMPSIAVTRADTLYCFFQ